MRTTQANRYARWSVIIAALLVVAMLGVYLRRNWQANEAKKNSPPSVPASVERTSEGFTYTQGYGDHTLFVLHASTATTFKGVPNASSVKDGEKNVLGGEVSITVYGRKGDRHDFIRTNSCDFYRPENQKGVSAKSLKTSERGSIVCAGDVQMDLQSAKDAKRVTAATPGSAIDPRIVHVLTKAVTFDISSADGQTDQPVEFQFSGGKGRAVGAVYSGDGGTLELLQGVHLSLQSVPPMSAVAANKPESPPIPIDISGSSVLFRRESNTAVLRGPVVVTQVTPAPPAGTLVKGAAAARTGSHVLHAAILTVNLDSDFHARQVTTEGDTRSRPNMVVESPKGAGTVTADKFVADLDSDGSAKHFSALGNVQADFTNAKSGETDHVSAGRLDAEMVPKINQPRLVTVSGGVKMNSGREGRARTLETASAEISFVPGAPRHPGAPPQYHPDRARTLTPATLTTREAVAGSSQPRVTRATGQQVDAEFDDRNRMRRLLAHNGAQLDRDTPGKPHQSSTSQEMTVNLDTSGQWTTVDQSGNVHFQSADQTGQAATAHADRATDLVTLSGSAEASDAASRTSADTIVFNQAQNDVRADGRVVTTYRKPTKVSATAARGSVVGNGGPLSLGSDPANIMADHLVGNSSTGHAVFSGHARLWQGDSTMEADEIELDQASRQLDARGNVRAVFIQVGSSAMAKPIAAPAAPPSRSRGANTKPPVNKAAAPTGPDVIRLRAGSLTYWDAKSQMHMEGGCTADSRQGTISGKACDLFFVPSDKPGATVQPPATTSPLSPQTVSGASQRLDHAIFTGGVVVRQEDRHATGERAEYDSVAGKFVISGGNPTIYDAAGNSTRGRQLTFLLADDTILVESETGVRTLTRYQVKK